MTPPARPAPLAGAILAGGAARRLGGIDKSQLPIAGRPILARELEVLRQLTPHVFLVVGDGQRAGALAHAGVPVVVDARPGTGAIGGIYTALVHADTDAVLTLACDLPFLTAPLLGHLVEASAGHDAAWVETARGVEPLVACYRQSARRPIERAIAAGHLKAADLGRILRVATVGSSDVEHFGPADRLLMNVNTRDDYERAAAAAPPAREKS